MHGLNLLTAGVSKNKIKIKIVMQNTSKKGHLGVWMALIITLVFVGCNKEDAPISQEVMEETAFAENVFAQLSVDIDDAVPLEGVSSGRFGFGGFGFGFGNCMTRTVETPEDTEYPKVITIEYEENCTSPNGVVKSGKITITLTGHPSEEGSERIVTFENFTVNGNSIEGTKTFTYKGAGEFECTLKNGKILTPDGDVIIRESTKSRVLIEGGDTEDRSDDVYAVTGEIIGETSDGLSYKKVIDEENPLIVSRDCFWITKGIVTTTIGDAVSTVDFGDGTCDNIATRIDEEGEEEFTMEMRIRKMWRHQHSHRGGK